MATANPRKYLIISYLILIIYVIHRFFLYYALSTYLSQYFSDSTISLLFACGSILSLVAAVYFSRFLKRYSNRKTLFWSTLFQFLATLVLVFSNYLNIYTLAIFFLVHYTMYSVIYTSINVYLEEFSDPHDSGRVRGTILAILNFGTILSPFISSQAFTLLGYAGLFFLSAVSITPILFILKKIPRTIREPDYKVLDIFQSLEKIKTNKNILGVMMSSLALNIFYAILNIYLTLYLTTVIGIPITLMLAILIPISILPSIILPYWVGKLSDQKLSAKKIMIWGIVITGFTLISIYLYHPANIFLWIILLLILRTGATLNETENYTYFYKIINKESAPLIAIFQNISNLGALFITVLSLIMFDVFSARLELIFLVSGIICLLSVIFIRKIQNGKLFLAEEVLATENK